MSTEAADADMWCCATCGRACGVSEGGKQDKGLELRDKVLFTPPEGSHLGECPICCLPLSLDQSKSVTMTCCCKVICRGCDYANQRREDEAGLEKRCAFCREPLPKSQEEINKRCKKRMKKNDPVAIYQMGNSRLQKGDYKTAFEYFAKAAELEDTQAHYTLSVMYNDGEGVEKDGEKRIYHLEEAAIGGHADARFNLGIEEWKNGRYERAAKHFIIAAKTLEITNLCKSSRNFTQTDMQVKKIMPVLFVHTSLS